MAAIMNLNPCGTFPITTINGRKISNRLQVRYHQEHRSQDLSQDLTLFPDSL